MRKILGNLGTPYATLRLSRTSSKLRSGAALNLPLSMSLSATVTRPECQHPPESSTSSCVVDNCYTPVMCEHTGQAKGERVGDKLTVLDSISTTLELVCFRG